MVSKDNSLHEILLENIFRFFFHGDFVSYNIFSVNTFYQIFNLLLKYMCVSPGERITKAFCILFDCHFFIFLLVFLDWEAQQQR